MASANNKENKGDTTNIKKFQFTPTEIAHELSEQGLTSIKGEKGAELLYLYIQKVYSEKKKDNSLTEEIFSNCGVNAGHYKGDGIYIGEFILIPNNSIFGLFSTTFMIKHNPTVFAVLKQLKQ